MGAEPRAIPSRKSTTSELEERVSPRFGAAYDLFGNGKTAIKVNLGRYLEGPNLTSFTRAANPADAIAVSAMRTWSDANRDFVPQLSELGALNAGDVRQHARS